MDRVSERQVCSEDSHRIVEPIYRKPNATDLKQIHEIALESFSKPWSESDFAYFIENPCGLNFVVEVAGQVRGYILSLCVLGEVDVVSVAVAKKFRQQGIAKHLVRELVGSLGVDRAFLEVDVENISAIELYRRNGFEIIGVRNKYYEGKRDALLMRWVARVSSVL